MPGGESLKVKTHEHWHAVRQFLLLLIEVIGWPYCVVGTFGGQVLERMLGIYVDVFLILTLE